MLRGLYASATGMQAEARRMETLANNLANASTIGYKRDTSLQADFQPVLLSRLADRDDTTGLPAAPTAVGAFTFGTRPGATATRLADGHLRRTGGGLDVALTGDGFFAVATPRGVRYTRDGAFGQDASGRLVTQEGYAVLVDGRPVSGRQITIGDDGSVRVDGAGAGTLTVVGSDRAGPLHKVGGNLWSVGGPGATLVVPAGSGGGYQLRVGYLETANLDPVLEMVELMAAMRSYEANQKAVQAQDQTLDKAVNEIGRG